MSRKDYIHIARNLCLTRQRLLQADCTVTKEDLFDEMVGDVADMLYADNPLFDRDRFFAAIYKEKV